MSADPAPWRRQSNQISGGGATSPSPGPPPGAPPPPPPYATGNIPSVRIPTEMSCRKEPPAAIQNAMMTKDKKPFTYTPGGLDLAEIRSPRMAKRISRNAHIEDSCTGAAAAAPLVHPHQLPPQALAAMQPQIAIAVLPPGATLPKPHGSPPFQGEGGPTSPPFASGAVPSPPPVPNISMTSMSPLMSSNGAPPPPPLPSSGASPPPPMPGSGAPPPPPMPTSGGPPPPPPLPSNGTFPSKALPSEAAPPSDLSSPSNTLRRNQPRPDYIADIANHAHTLKRVNHPPRSQAEQQSQAFPQVQLRQTGFHHRMQSNDEGTGENDETDKPEQFRQKSPSPPKQIPNGVSIQPEQPKNQNKSPSPVINQSPRPNFQQPLQQIPRPASQMTTPSPPVSNSPRMYRPQISPATPEAPRQKFSPPRTSPPIEAVKVFQPQTVASPPITNQQRMVHPQTFPAPPPTPEVPMQIYNKVRTSPPREVVTVFQPQVFQDAGTPHQTEKYQGRSRPPGLKMPDEREQAPRNTPPSSAGLRQSPAPWLSAQRHSISKDLPPWASREDATPPIRTPTVNLPQPFTTRMIPVQMEGLQQHQQQQQQQSPGAGRQGNVRIIPIRLEGTDDVIQPQTSQTNKYGNNSFYN